MTEETDAETEAEPDSAEETEPEEGEGEQSEDPGTKVNPEDVVANGKIVRVTYEGGKTFILNYNNYDVTVDGYDGVIPALNFVSYFAQEVAE